MVDFLSSWIEGIAVSVIIVSIFEMIIPEGNTKKYIKVILGIYVMFSIIAPFVNNKDLYSLDISDTIEDYLSDVEVSAPVQKEDNNLEQIYINTFEQEIKKIVEERGFDVKSCDVEAVFDTESEDFGISKISINLVSRNENYGVEDKQNTKIEDVQKVDISVNNKQESKETDITPNDIKELKKFLSDYYEIDKAIIDIQ